MPDYTLGLDIGSKSIGWALVSADETPEIIDMGVRVFPEGVDRDTKGLEKSKNATRREARGARRMHQRRADRKKRLVRLLRNVGLLPQGQDEMMSLFRMSPYELRKKGLDEQLDVHAFGRVLYHLSQRRGFKSNRKSGKPKEDGMVKKEAGDLQRQVDTSNCRTVGEYFAGLDPEQQRIRARYTFRSMYEKEFDLLWAKQAEFRPTLLADHLRRRIRDEIIFFQRPLKPADELIGNCELEAGQKRCPRGDWYALRFRILQDVNNLLIQNPDTSERRLSADERQRLLLTLSQKSEITFNDLRSFLGLIETQRFNLEQDGKVTKLKGNPFAAGMRNKKTFGPTRWDAMPEDEKIQLNKLFLELEDDELATKLNADYGLDGNQVDVMLKIALPQGYMRFSREAIKKLIPVMESGCLTSEAVKDIYGERAIGEAQCVDKLGLPPDIRNPIVQKALFEVRKVVNAIVREHGKPRRIKIEMARDVHGSMRQREELHWRMLEDKRRNEQVRAHLAEDIGIVDPSRDDVIKYKLWQECGVCPYTGRTISQEALFGPNPEFQIEHILPYDRSLDDSYMNKTLCEVHENIHVKRSQTPFEAYSHNPVGFEAMLKRINESKMAYPKRRRFWQKEMGLDTQISRELNDTRYICREVVQYLKQLGVFVQGTRGKITAELRHQWGLDAIFTELGVRRDDDHRRHAVDALVVAVTDNDHLRQLAASKYAKDGVRFAAPWTSFRDIARGKVSGINVSHRVSRKVSGPLHEETNYGPTGRKADRGQDLYVYRKALVDLTVPMVQKIVDSVVRDIVAERLEKHGVDLSEGGKPPKEVWGEPLYMRTTRSTKRVQIKKVRIQDVKNSVLPPFQDRDGNPYRAVEPGSNHHIEIFCVTDANGETRRDGRVVTMFEAVHRSQRSKPVVKKDYGDGKAFVCSASINEMFMLQLDDGKEELYRVQKISSNQQIFFRHHTFGGELSKGKSISKCPNTLKGIKVTVDPLGRVRPAND